MKFKRNGTTWRVVVNDKRASAICGITDDHNCGACFIPDTTPITSWVDIVRRVILWATGLSSPAIFIGSGEHQDAILAHELGHVVSGHMDDVALVKEVYMERAAGAILGISADRALQWEMDADAWAVSAVGVDAVRALLEYYLVVLGERYPASTVEISARLANL